MKKNNNGAAKQYALVTGATSGIGYEIAKLLAADGYNMVLVARDEVRLREVSEEFMKQYGIKSIILSKDLFDPNAAVEIYNEVADMNIKVDVLVNDAGQGEYGKFLETDLDRQLDIIELNVSSLVVLTHLFGKEMLKQGSGKILQLGSEVSKTPAPMMAVYGATKAFVISFSEALINELKDTNVSITVLMPGATDTDFFHKAGAENTVTYAEKNLDYPQQVAKDGYKAMMKGERRVISGNKTKLHVAMATLSPDEISAANMRKQMKESKMEDKKKRHAPSHSASRKEHQRGGKTSSKRGR